MKKKKGVEGDCKKFALRFPWCPVRACSEQKNVCSLPKSGDPCSGGLKWNWKKEKCDLLRVDSKKTARKIRWMKILLCPEEGVAPHMERERRWSFALRIEGSREKVNETLKHACEISFYPQYPRFTASESSLNCFLDPRATLRGFNKRLKYFLRTFLWGLWTKEATGYIGASLSLNVERWIAVTFKALVLYSERVLVTLVACLLACLSFVLICVGSVCHWGAWVGGKDDKEKSPNLENGKAISTNHPKKINPNSDQWQESSTLFLDADP